MSFLTPQLEETTKQGEVTSGSLKYKIKIKEWSLPRNRGISTGIPYLQ